ncbi:hypothetical protein QBC45DRAFT_455036 [Copromyces sp. CBS 386.78]|nr:hypothetical protein QBC45DRAFT_455036 [Copromyces sp. CBS 386.78]
MSFRAMANLAAVLLALLVALFPIVAQAEALGCRAHSWETSPKPRQIPTTMSADVSVLQALNMTDFAAELRAAGWSQLSLGYDNFIFDHAGNFDGKALRAYMEPGHQQGMPHENQKWCADYWDRNLVSFRRKDAIAQMDRFCGPASPLHGKVLRGPLSVKLRIPTPPQDSRYNDHQYHPDDMGLYWLEWTLYVEDGCEWMHDEEDCFKYMYGALDGCRCHIAEEKWGGAVMNRCYMFGLWMAPGFYDIHYFKLDYYVINLPRRN